MLTRVLFLSLTLAFAATGQNPPPGAMATFDKIYQSLRDNYPMPELPGWRGEEWYGEFKSKIAAARTRVEAFDLMEEFVCRMNDYHTRLSWPDRPQLLSPRVRVEPVVASGRLPPGFGIWGRLHPPVDLPKLGGVAIAVVEAAESSGLRPGDEIVSVDGVPVEEALAGPWRHVVGSSVGGKLRGAAGRLLVGEPNSESQVGVRRTPGGSVETVTVSRRAAGPATPATSPMSRRDVEGVPLIRISQLSGDGFLAQFDKLLEDVRSRPGLIVDVRGNGGGFDQLAGDSAARFLAAPIVASISFERIVPSQNFVRTVETLAPRGEWRYRGRVAVLIDEGCMSACEHFVSAMVESGALMVGTPTSGACGHIRTVDLPGGVKLNVSRTFPLHSGIPSPQVGIAPHLWVRDNLEDLRGGRDAALSAALEWVRSRDPLPVRLQPVWPLVQ